MHLEEFIIVILSNSIGLLVPFLYNTISCGWSK